MRKSREEILKDVYAAHLSVHGQEEKMKQASLTLLLDIRDLLVEIRNEARGPVITR